MNIMITARHFDPTKPLKSSIEEKITKLQKFSRDLIEAHMIVEREDKRSGAELILRSKTSDFYANAKSYDMHLAIDNVIRKMRTQLKTHQEKLKEHK